MRFVILATALFVSLLPSPIKILVYRWLYGYRIGNGVRIGFGTGLTGLRRCRIGDHVRIGCFNCFFQIDELEIGDQTRIGCLNVFRGGRLIDIGDYVTILRLNVFNSIPKPDIVTPADPMLQLGTGVFITTGHWLDFTDRITIESHVVLGGRGSSLWTHNRQRTRPILINAHCYLGSGVQLAPGVELPEFCIVALGAVLMGQFAPSHSLIVGNPAIVQRPLRDRDVFLVTRKTRNDIPDETAYQGMSVELKTMYCSNNLYSHTADVESGR